MATTLTRPERALAVVAGWQAECAAQPHATHLVGSCGAVDPDVCPVTLGACIQFGRKLLRAHLEVVRRKVADFAVEEDT